MRKLQKYIEMESFTDALEEGFLAVQLDDENGDAFNILGDCYYLLGYLDNAYKSFHAGV